jgi:biotin carboxyl carrier protein
MSDEVGMKHAGIGGNVMIYVVKINNKEYEVEVEKGKANLLKTTESVASIPAVKTVEVKSEPAKAAAPAAPVVQGAGEPIKAPMPGNILDIKVSAGKSVKKGDILVILEAMKMENEIVAPRDGVVTQIVVAKGAVVSTNDVLLTIQ